MDWGQRFDQPFLQMYSGNTMASRFLGRADEAPETLPLLRQGSFFYSKFLICVTIF